MDGTLVQILSYLYSLQMDNERLKAEIETLKKLLASKQALPEELQPVASNGANE